VRSTDSRTFTERARRAQIIDRATELVAEIGYAQTSIRKIADRVGVAMSVVLYHFANKEELVKAIVADAYQGAIAAIVPPLDAESTATGKLRAYIRANAAFMAAHRTQFMAVLDIGLSYRSAAGKRLDELAIDPGLATELASLDLAAIIRSGQETGEFRPLDVDRTVVAIRGALNGAVLEIARDPEFDLLGYGEELVTLFDLSTGRQ
jgi:AcrR family transcriptional regulator